MFAKLVSHNKDLQRLVEKGYAVAFDSNCMVIRDIPYLDEQKQLQNGAIVTKLVFVNQEHVIQDDHQIFFAGSVPYNLDGQPIPNLGGGESKLALSDACADVVVQRSFSNKPIKEGKFNDFFEKIESYVTIISGPAIELYDATPYTFRVVEEAVPDSIFKVQDTLTSRAEIADLSAKFNDDIIGIIGLGGTGAYLLDFLVKTSVREIRVFDLDEFHVHNAFRSPGKLELDELGKKKTEVYSSRYNNFRTGLSANAKFIDSSCIEDLDGVTFAFVCVDKGSSRDNIFKLLISKGIPFIDVGMGIDRRNDLINGQMRTTYYSAEQGQLMYDKMLAPLSDNQNDLYKTNIQISELNALNACLAIIKFKQIRGFYFTEIPYYNLLFEVGDLKIVGESNDKEN